MALSVLHLKSLYNDAKCGVWNSETNGYMYRGSYSDCFTWKQEWEKLEQEQQNQEYLSKLIIERELLFGDMGVQSL